MKLLLSLIHFPVFGKWQKEKNRLSSVINNIQSKVCDAIKRERDATYHSTLHWACRGPQQHGCQVRPTTSTTAASFQ